MPRLVNHQMNRIQHQIGTGHVVRGSEWKCRGTAELPRGLSEKVATFAMRLEGDEKVPHRSLEKGTDGAPSAKAPRRE